MKDRILARTESQLSLTKQFGLKQKYIVSQSYDTFHQPGLSSNSSLKYDEISTWTKTNKL